MHCDRIKLLGSGVAIVCSSGSQQPRCKFCGRNPATLLCDAKVGQTLAGDPITCDARMCASCSRPVGPDRDACPNHSLQPVRKTIRDPLTRKELSAAGYRWIAVGECRGCEARIEWWETPNKKPDGSMPKMPMTVREDDRLINHWSVCPTRRQFRAANKKHAERAHGKKPEQGALKF